MVKRNNKEIKIYSAEKCCIFRKTKEIFGGLSNMASGFPLEVNGIRILTSEALYQACRFPHLPDVQEKIIKEKSPMSAKMVSKPFRDNSRPDWDEVRLKIMKWCLRVKLAQNFSTFGKLLESTFDKPIVEDSSKDPFWGAIRDKNDHNILKGINALGRLLMWLRQYYNENRFSYEIFVVEPLDIPDLLLYDRKIEIIDERKKFIDFIKKSLHFNTFENDFAVTNENIIMNQIDNNIDDDPKTYKKRKIKAASKSKKRTIINEQQESLEL